MPHHVELEVSLPATQGSTASAAVVKARLDAAHLADHPAAAAALWGALKPGVKLEGLLVLQRLEVRCFLGVGVEVRWRRRSLEFGWKCRGPT